ncbi:N-acetylmuramoyl-L-alanine amidase family protein [Bacilliculturomica massiliensis]|uniref:N-acetylmuramoyl-L-alanine amidase family protein n=1 Tax=Bacilliculturomica massiliensis TaxID=1917867 RepID=UPI0013EF1194|nr:N-acetylmuramoyl-L-alanine amidase family protein [Bacilliculturomica massiliensis]
MMRGLRVLLFILAVMIAMTGAAFAAVDPVTMKLDGKVIETEVPPTIISGRTMVPAKFLFESMGGTVEWLEAARQVKIGYDGTEVLLTIDSKTALVNGNEIKMDVAPTIVSRRTLIPAALVAEQLGCKVNWINETRVVEIFTPDKTEKALITGIETEETSNGTYRVIIEADRELSAYKDSLYDSPDRFVLDISGAKLDQALIPEGMTEGSIEAGNEMFDKVRFSQFEAATVRVVVDLTGKAEGEVSLSADNTSLYIDLKESEDSGSGPSGNGSTPGDVGNNGSPADLAGTDIPMLAASMQDKLIVIDPGHGGSDPGSQGKDSSGNVLQNEKDLNLTIALRLNELLQAAGAKTYMLRSDDSTMALYDRPAKANELGADLYVAVHNNSNESSTPNGTEVHYYNKNMDRDYGYVSKDIADSVHQEIIATIGLKDRGVKSSPSLAVLNRSVMPAIIIEGAFLSNPTELVYMMTDQFKEAYAVGAARGIIKGLNASAEAF